MTTKAKIIFADYVLRLMSCPRNMETWKIKTVEDFLESGMPVNKKEIRKYIVDLEQRGYRRAHDIEPVLLELFSHKQKKLKKTEKADASRLSERKLSEEHEETLIAFDRWLIHEREFSTHTARSYVDAARRYFCMFATVSQKEVVAFKQYLLTTGLSPATINLRMNGIVTFGKFLGKKLDVKRIRVRRSLECNNVPSEEDMTRYLDYVKGKNLYWYLVSRCLSTTGLRVHELLKVTYRDILNGSVILIGKGSKQRRIFFQRRFIEEIKEYLEARSVLLDERFCPKTTRGVAQQINLYSKQAHLDPTKFHPHAFRHYFAKQYLRSNPSDIIGLQNLLGHSSIETTSIYLQRSYEEQLSDYHNNVIWQ